MFAAATAKSLQSCPTLCDPRDGSRPGSPVPGILQARTLEWVASSFSNAWKWKVKVKSLSRVRLLATSWTAAYQAPPSMGFSRQEYWSGVHSRLRKQQMQYLVRIMLSCLKKGYEADLTVWARAKLVENNWKPGSVGYGCVFPVWSEAIQGSLTKSVTWFGLCLEAHFLCCGTNRTPGWSLGLWHGW